MRPVLNVVPIGSLVLGILIAIVLHRYSPVAILWDYPWTLIGTALIAIGVTQFSWATAQFARKKTDIRPAGTPSVLMRNFPYSYTRNPIYLSNILVLLGTCIVLGSFLPFVVIPIYFVIVATAVIPKEEENLTKIFGDSYREYQRSVRRWL